MSRVLENCTRNNLFMFNSQYYLQIDGAPMGGCFSSTLANIFLNFREKEWLEECPCSIKPTLYRRYVDDTFMLFSSKSQVNAFLQYMNSRHPSIKFTSDEEKDQQLPFLDVLVTRNHNRSFSTDVYRKPTNTDLYLNYNSAVNENFKFNLIGCLLDRAYKICSSFESFHFQIVKIRNFFIKNSYPQHLIDSIVRRKLDKIFCKNSSVSTVNREPFFVGIPFFDKKTNENLKSDLTKLAYRFYPQISLKIIFQNNFSIKSFFPSQSKTGSIPFCNLTWCISTAVRIVMRLMSAKLPDICTHVSVSIGEYPTEQVTY